MSPGGFQAFVVDTSVFADYYLLYPGKPERHDRARTILDRLSDSGLLVYEPFLFEIELRAVLVRRIKPEIVLEMVEAALRHVNVIREELIHDRAAEIAILTGCRAVDAYYIAAARYVDAILITNDKVMKYNSLKSEQRAYYLLDDKDFEILLKIIINN